MKFIIFFWEGSHY